VAFLTDYTIWRVEYIGGFEAGSIKPAEATRKITRPVMLVHEEKDNRIKHEYGFLVTNDPNIRFTHRI